MEISPNNLSSKPEIDVRIAHSDPWIGDSSRTSRRIFLDSDSSTLEQIYAKRDDARDDDAVQYAQPDLLGRQHCLRRGRRPARGFREKNHLRRGAYFSFTTFRLPDCPYSYQKGLLPLTVYVIHVTRD